MHASLPISPLPPHRGRHAGIIALGLLIATTAVVWTTHDRSRQPGHAVDPAPAPAAVTAPAAAARATESPPVERSVTPVPKVITAKGAVTFDESRTQHIRTPVAGAFIKARPSYLGRTVRAGETVGIVYSFDVYFTTVELIGQLRDFRSQELVDRARLRLLRMGMRREQLARIEKSMQPTAQLPLLALVSGKVIAEPSAARQLVDPSMGDLMTITDPTRAAIYVDVPIADAEQLEVGQTVRVTLGEARPIAAPIGYIAPPYGGTRTVRVDLVPYRLKMPPDLEATIELARAPR